MRSQRNADKVWPPDLERLRISRAPLDAGTARIYVSGEIDLASSPSLREAIKGVLADHPERLMIHLDAVTFADSQLVHALEHAHQDLPEGRSSLRVIGANRGVRRLLAICGLEHLCDGTP